MPRHREIPRARRRGPRRVAVAGQQVGPDLGQLCLEARAGLAQLGDGVVDVLALLFKGDNAVAELAQGRGVLRRAPSSLP